MEAWDVVVVGAGAAGLVAAERAAERGFRTLLLEKNRKPGVKILMSGGTRCNLTHDTDRAGIVKAFGDQGKFLQSALAALPPRALVDLVEGEGVRTKVEDTGKVFPVSDRALDVLDAFLKRLARTQAVLRLEAPLESFEPGPGGFVLHTPQGDLSTRALVLTTGGKSYPGCGTCGDGYAWAERIGHLVTPLRPALTPIKVPPADVLPLQGLTLPHVRVRIVDPPVGNGPSKKPLVETVNSLLFAHFGLSGPAALDPSRAVSGHPQPQRLRVELDFVPDVTAEAIAEALRVQGQSSGKRLVLNALPPAIPARLADELCRRAGVPPDRTLANLGKPERARLVDWIKRWSAPVLGVMGFAKAEVTAGGVSLAEVDSRTMQSKKVPGLYFAGEILDVDGPIGGFNFQAAFSTGWLAGEKLSLLPPAEDASGSGVVEAVGEAKPQAPRSEADGGSQVEG